MLHACMTLHHCCKQRLCLPGRIITHMTYGGLAKTVYDRIFGDFPAKNTVYTPYIYGSGQP